MNQTVATLFESLPDVFSRGFTALPVEAGVLIVVFGLVLLAVSSLRRRPPRRPVTEDTPGQFETRPVLNASERRLHAEIERLMPQHFHHRARLLSQVAVAEFIYAPEKRDFWTIGAKRVDMLIVDGNFQPLCAIEYQGAGHYGSNAHSRAKARSRDWAKRRALRIAGVPLVEIPAEYDARLLGALLGDVTGRRPETAPQRRNVGVAAG